MSSQNIQTMSIQDKIKIIQRNKLKDSRGWFLKIINGHEEDLPQFTGEIYITSAIPGETKGEHYHSIANEWFTLIEGKCKLKLYDIVENEYFEIDLEGDLPRTIFVPSGIAHSFENNSHDNFIVIAYTDKLYDPADTIKHVF
jgi:dTDP-4-dehydrorhamnose 3,5-epimerase-like enzyme